LFVSHVHLVSLVCLGSLIFQVYFVYLVCLVSLIVCISDNKTNLFPRSLKGGVLSRGERGILPRPFPD